MKAIHALTIINNINDTKRTGDDLKRADSGTSDFLIEAEQIFEKLAPLPTSFDVSCGQSCYFSEFAYQDVLGAMYLKTQSTEVNARVMEEAVINCENETMPSQAVEYLTDKYVLHDYGEEIPESMVFLPGSNNLGIENKESLLPLLWSDPLVMIKPHPNMTEEGMRHFGMEYGWDRLIHKDISGYEILNGCKRAWSTANSEMGLIAAVIKKPHADITSIMHFERLTYSAIHRLFQPMNVEHNYNTFARMLNSNESGWIPPWATTNEIEERINGFIQSAMKHRHIFKPSFPDVSRWRPKLINVKEPNNNKGE